MRALRLRMIIAVSMSVLVASLMMRVWAAEVRVSWEAPTQFINGEPILVPLNHRVYYGLASGQYEVGTDVGEATSATLNGFDEGVTYYFAVSAQTSSSAESALSEEVVHTVPVSDPGDTTPPVAAITAPLDGAIVVRKSTVTIVASATDNVSVASVEIFVDGASRCVDTLAPYSCTWKVPAANHGRQYVLEAVAVDPAGNAATSPPITVTAQ